ncbi:MAG: pseudouridine synthase [Tissierellia bacterium]|nr:pseudouridine synthase [Tissierellia bacterium]
MTKAIRLDKLLGNMGYGSRKELKGILRAGDVTVNGQVEKNPAAKILPSQDQVRFLGEEVLYREFIYLMMNKPKGVISATEDDFHRTVIDLLEEEDRVFCPYPVGRLDIDTMGLLLITNDGELTHNLLSPKKGVPKTYYAEVTGELTEADVCEFEVGIYLEPEDYTTLPARLQILEVSEGSKALVTIQEGKYHQVKRMFEKVGKKVLELKRLSMGSLELDPGLMPGEYRELTEQELRQLKGES